ncbi:hypothetical protein CPB83DRAFT_857357 [Crepidotus variabilis]|uniref:Uncharacterized protein n=1 Tax=Crepidotus variabilis TaxID=179855 RepID=A0A9P6ED32_9AGAR|nr:hypothetical protein CPB83DRAFT_857357 [Crepidotus variabilis]
MFLYQVARVCTSCLEILKRVPEYWTFPVFDVTLDPTPFLDVFKWSPGYFISVCIFHPEFSSLNEGRVELPRNIIAPQRKSAEQDCVSQITDALMPHVWRCLAINYRLLYSSNLPQ